VIAGHAKKIGDELVVDIDHYQKHPDRERLWCVVFDENHLLPNPGRVEERLGRSEDEKSWQRSHYLRRRRNAANTTVTQQKEPFFRTPNPLRLP
jgi:hypothetical protein